MNFKSEIFPSTCIIPILNVHDLQIHVKTVLIVVKAWAFGTNEAFIMKIKN